MLAVHFLLTFLSFPSPLLPLSLPLIIKINIFFFFLFRACTKCLLLLRRLFLQSASPAFGPCLCSHGSVPAEKHLSWHFTVYVPLYLSPQLEFYFLIQKENFCMAKASSRVMTYSYQISI